MPVDVMSHFDPMGVGIDPRDADTPDNWVPRHPDMVRLTGRHPYNVEPPLDKLMANMLTPPPLHFVRDHGAVPKLNWEDHKVSVSGFVNNPFTFTMDELESWPTISFPCTLTCAGNRRKEQNMTKQTVGFNWGPSGTSCSVWKGVPLRYILEKAGIKTHGEGAKYVCFVGADKLPNGYYGTSMTAAHAMDPLGDVIIAYEQAGKRLMPDHGYPCRLIIPGWIGGRMVKWLTEIKVTEKESDNYYHFFDNRILPPQVDKERADKEGWWYKPEYLFNELNINSVISSPGHGEVIPLDAASKPYTMQGYAYTGGGRKVTRVELSFDGGNTWDLTELHHMPDTEGGRNWCWCHWEYKAPISLLLSCTNKDVRCRAWDNGNNTQADFQTWNVMGMGNNHVFSVKVHPAKTSQNSVGGIGIWFEQPTIPGPGAGGWMVKPQEEFPLGTKPVALKEPPTGGRQWIQSMTSNAAYSPLSMLKGGAKPDAPMKIVPSVAAVPKAAPEGARVITMAEVEQHAAEDDCWIVVDGKVYDATPFLEEHPGGAASITMNGGMDTTEDFDAVHSDKARKMLEDFYIGELGDVASGPAPGGVVEEPALAPATPKVGEPAPVALDPKKKIKVTLVKKEELSHDTRRFRFALQSDKHVLGLPCGNHMFIIANIDGAPCMRAYTPASGNDDVGYFELVVKVYFANVHPRFPDGGKMSQHLNRLAIGDSIEVKGPLGHFTYLGKGEFMVGKDKRSTKKIGLICGGTGITPAYQVVREILKDDEDKTEVMLLYANQTPADILLREDLDGWARDHPTRFKCHYTVDRVPEGEPEWKYSVGFISDVMIKEHLPAAAGADSFVGMCGPPPMINFACIPNLQKVGYVEENYMSF
mmetsp:Transcript_14041/g.34307  ORF Transcript_14041/g.34307 Transcript_14041/m.34307 type:complete len:869 (+) Transcript_14041:220-2826(+)